MRLLIIALTLIAAIYTVVAVAIAWWEIYSKVPVYDMFPVALYFVPIGALWVSCVALWKITSRPQP